METEANPGREWDLLCYRCIGWAAESPDNKCKACNDKGATIQTKPTQDLITDDGLTLFEYYKFLKNYNIWPEDGGLSKQPAIFIKTIKYCDAVIAKFNMYKNDKDKATSELANKQSQMK